MNRRILPSKRPSKRILLPHSMALILTPVLFLLAHVAMPRELSLHSTRRGWDHGRPGRLNWLGLIFIGIGAAGVLWCTRLHFLASHDSFELAGSQPYLIVRGPYQFTRNPVYLSEMVIWLGWAIFYGSVRVLLGSLVVWGSLALLVVPWEERQLEARFGEAYLRYKHSVPRWFGLPNR
jgi:protein-S-isoprenylcysteine O-methyltransferase Ste14